MSIGSFLATAGEIGEGIDVYQTQSAQRQLMRDTMAAQRAELARAEEQRRLLQEAALANVKMLPQQAGVMTPGAARTSNEILPSLAAPYIPPATTGGGGGARVGLDTGAARTPTPSAKAAPQPASSGRVMKIGNTVIPWFNPKADPNRLHTAGVGGFKVLDPNASDVEQAAVTFQNDTALGIVIKNIADNVKPAYSGLRKPVVSQKDKAELQKRDDIAKWYRSDDAKAYFARNPEVLSLAENSPVRFYEGLVKANELAARQRTAPAGIAAPTQAELTTASARSGSFADIPFSQVKSFITGREGPAHLGGYNAIAYNTSPTTNKAGVPQPPRPLTSMTIKEVLDFQRNVMRPATRGYRGKNDVGSTGVGAYQFESGTLAENARIALGDNWTNTIFSPEVQDRIAETLYNRARGDRKTLGNTWFAFRGVSPSDPQLAGEGGIQQAGLTTEAAAQEPVLNLTKLNTYLGNPDKIAPTLSYTLAQRDYAYRQAQIFAQVGNAAGYEETISKLQMIDANLARLEGAQAIVDIQNFNNPARAERLLSYLSNGAIRVKMRTDGSFAYFTVNPQGQEVPIPGQDNVKRSQFINTLRAASDETYRARMDEAQAASAAARAKLLGEMELKQFEGRIEGELQGQRLQTDINKAILDAQVELEKAKMGGSKVSTFTSGNDTFITRDNPSNRNDPLLGRVVETTLPTGEVIRTIDERPFSEWSGTAR